MLTIGCVQSSILKFDAPEKDAVFDIHDQHFSIQYRIADSRNQPNSLRLILHCDNTLIHEYEPMAYTEDSIQLAIPNRSYPNVPCTLKAYYAQNLLLGSSHDFQFYDGNSVSRTRVDMTYGRLTVMGYANERTRDGRVVKSDRNAFYEFRQKVYPNGHRIVRPPRRSTMTDHHQEEETLTKRFAFNMGVDEFQVGRDAFNDFVVVKSGNAGLSSRQSFRVVCERTDPTECRIYAAGFDRT
jgi:hypothetical protein